ncbi:MAG: diguanylate cyclase, partial [Woeseiaceae bacterium]|nr:diguanylate cyclase [Woeseiaceae bacterium]
MKRALLRLGVRGRRRIAAWRDWLQRRNAARKRVLVNEILSIQVVSAGLVGALAIAALYWGGQWVLQDNYGRWALQWTEELNELGAPLYLADDREALIRLESFVGRYPEIDRVAYFDAAGEALFSVDNRDDLDAIARLPETELAKARDVMGSNRPYLLSGGILNPRQFEIIAPVWTESLVDDGLFGFDPDAADEQTRAELLGFVAIHLDFVIFHDRLLSNIRSAVFVLLVMLIVFALYGRRALRKALASISDLQEPIRELARGNLDVKFQPAAHREISDIVEALETTASALSERDAALRELANHDSLTGLLNRRRFVEELRKEVVGVIRDGHTSALFFIDLDQFKYINDACGHPAGDRLIRKVADELRRSVRRHDKIARFGGDEFAILLCNTDVQGAQASAATILGNMRRLAHIEDGRVFHVHCSIGITMLTGDNLHHDELINQADIACREAKSAGRNRLTIYTPSADSDARKQADVGWMNSLRRAVDDDEFELRFQPINRIDTGETTHHEVLIRLRTDDGQLVAPDAFLPAAVRFGLMSEIDFWMIRHAAKAYAEHSGGSRQLRLAINLSANAFENDDLVAFVDKMFTRHGVDPGNIILEVTESLAIRRPVHVDRQIAALRDMGCQFALDDFGTGYSSFSYLQ